MLNSVLDCVSRLISWRGRVAYLSRISGLALALLSALSFATAAHAQDTTPPRITSIERQTPSTNPTNADSVTWRVTFDEAVSTQGATSFGLTNAANVTDDATLQLDVVRSVTTAVVGGTTYLFAAGYGDDGVSVFSVADNGALTNVANVSDAGSLALWGASSVTTAVVDGTTYLFVAGYEDDGVSVFSVANDGTLTNVANVTDAGLLELDGVRSVTTAVVNGTTYLFAAGTLDDGVSVFSVADNGALTNVANVSDDPTLQLAGASSVTTAVVDGTTYLFAAGFTDDGVSVFSVANNGGLTNVANVTDNATLELYGAASVTTAVVNGTTYLFAAGFDDHGVSVFSVASSGALTNVANVSDDGALELDAAASVTAAVVNGTTYLFAAGYNDNGVSVFSVANNGTLTNVANVSDDGALELDGAASVTTAVVNGTTYLFAAGFDDDGVSVFSVTPPAAAVASFTLAGTTGSLTETVFSPTIVDVTASGGDLANLNATVTLGFAAGQAFADTAGNALTNTTPTGTNDNTFVLDNTAPTLAITGPAGPVSGEFTARLVFSEPITGFDISEIIVGNGSAKDLRAEFALPNGISSSSAIPPATNFLVTITPVSDGVVTVDVAGAAVQDGATNGNTAATQFSVTNDETAPTLAVTGPAGPGPGAFTATFTFSEDVTGFVVSDITVGNGAASAFDDAAAPIYTATITPAADGAVTIDVAGAVATDAAGNDNTAATQFSVTNDETAPTLAVTGPAGPVSGAFTATFTFDEDVTGFVVGDITVGNGAASAFQATSATVYTATITPTVDGAVTVDVAGSVATDAAGNANTAASQFSVTNDKTLPTLALSRPSSAVESFAGSGVYFVGGAFTLPITFSEPVTGLDISDITVGNGTATNLRAEFAFPDSVSAPDSIPAAASYRVTITPLGDAPVTVDMAQGVAQDEAGNGNSAATRFSINADLTPAQVGSIALVGNSTTNADTITWYVTFSETVALDAGDMTATGTTASLSVTGLVGVPASTGVEAVSDAGPGRYPEYRVTASGGDLASLNGVVTLGFAAGASVTNISGLPISNFTPMGQSTPSVTLANAGPRVVNILRQAPVYEFAAADTITWRVSFDTDVLNVTADDFLLTGTTASLAVTPVSAREYELTASGGNLAGLDGNISLIVNCGPDITDLSGNYIGIYTPLYLAQTGYTIDNTAPTATITAPAEVGGTTPFDITVTFSEPVFFFTNTGEVAAVNATTSAPTGTGTTYSVTVTPTGAGDIQLHVIEGAVLDRTLANENPASSPVTVHYDGAGPRLTSVSRLSPAAELTNADSLTWQILFDEGAQNVDAGDFTVTGTTATVTNVSATNPPGSLVSAPNTPAAQLANTVTVSGGDLANLANGVVSLGLVQGATIADEWGNDLTNTATSGTSESYTIRNPDQTYIAASVYNGVANGFVGGPDMTVQGAIYASALANAEHCSIAVPQGLPATMSYRLLDNGVPTGAVNPVFDVTGGTTLTFQLNLAPSSTTDQNGVDFFPVFECFNATADTITGFNSIRLNIGNAPTPGILSIPFTPTFDGALRIPSSGDLGVLSTVAVNVGRPDGSSGDADTVTMTVSVDSGSAQLPLSSLLICQTDGSTGACISPLGASVTSDWPLLITQTFAVYTYDNGTTGIPFDPSNARLFVRYTDASGIVRGIDSVPVTSPAPAGATALASASQNSTAGRYQVAMRQPDGAWPNLEPRIIHALGDGTAILDDGIAPRRIALAADTDMTPASLQFGDERITGEGYFRGIRDARSDTDLSGADIGGTFSSPDGNAQLSLGANGAMAGAVGGCAVSGRLLPANDTASGVRSAALTFSGCGTSGSYTGVLSAANDNGLATLLIANETHGWRLER